MIEAGQGLLQAIIENPDNYGTRLIFADWLEEHDCPEWSEFIRIHCYFVADQIPEGERKICPDCRLPIGGRGWTLLHKNGKDSIEKLFARALRKRGCPGVRATWRGGFLSKVTMTCARWLEVGNDLRKKTPLEEVTLTHIQQTGMWMRNKMNVFFLLVAPGGVQQITIPLCQNFYGPAVIPVSEKDFLYWLQHRHTL